MSDQATVLLPNRQHLETYSRHTALDMKSQKHQKGLGDRLQESATCGAPTSTGG